MFTFYLAVMTAVAAAGAVCAALAPDNLLLAAGLLMVTVGGGGLSAGLMTASSHAPRTLKTRSDA